MTTYLGYAAATSTSVNLILPYGTELIVILTGKASAGASAAPDAGSYGGYTLQFPVYADSVAGALETSCSIFYGLRSGVLENLTPNTSYSAAVSGGSGTSSWIVAAAFGGLDQAAPTSTDSNTGAWDLQLNGLLNDLMVGILMIDGATTPTVSGATMIYSANQIGVAYHILTANESPHTIDWSAAGEDARDTSCAAMFAGWKGTTPIWM